MKKFAGYWQQGLPKLDSITWRPVADNNTRAAMLQTGEAQFAFPIPYEQAALLEKIKTYSWLPVRQLCSVISA